MLVAERERVAGTADGEVDWTKGGVDARLHDRVGLRWGHHLRALHRVGLPRLCRQPLLLLNLSHVFQDQVYVFGIDRLCVGSNIPKQVIIGQQFPSDFFRPDFVSLGFLSSSHQRLLHNTLDTEKKQNFEVQSFSSNMTNGIVNGNASLEAQFGQFRCLVRYATLIFTLCSLSRHQRDEIYICPPSFEKRAARCFHPISISIHQWVRRMLSCI